LWCRVSFFGSGGKWFLVLRTYLVYNTVVRLCQFFCCCGKVNFVRIPYSHNRFSKISRTFFVKKLIPLSNLRTRRPTLSCFVWIYNHTVTIVSEKYQELCLISELILIGFLYFRETTCSYSGQGFPVSP
jgi:hypothetical protein